MGHAGVSQTDCTQTPSTVLAISTVLTVTRTDACVRMAQPGTQKLHPVTSRTTYRSYVTLLMCIRRIMGQMKML